MELIVVNTIGLTGADVLAAELASFPDVWMLPGQNFISHDHVCYRPHDYAGADPRTIFEELSKHHYTRGGVCWAGLTKHATPAFHYPREQHYELFLRTLEGHDFLDLVSCFISSFYQSLGETGPPRYLGYFGHNVAMNASAYPGFVERVRVVDFSNPIALWLANIHQRMIWDSTRAIGFWLVNSLFMRRFARLHPRLLSISLTAYNQDPEGQRRALASFLGLPPIFNAREELRRDAFLRYDPLRIANLEERARELEAIYAGYPLFEAARCFEDWADEVLARVGGLLDRYQRFWNTTMHTNLDWLGPIEEEVLAQVPQPASRTNLSFRFYHEYFSVQSDRWNEPEVRLEHALGFLEEELVLPCSPSFVRIALAYLESVAGNAVKRAYSAADLRQGHLYRQLLRPEYQALLRQNGLGELWDRLELSLDRALQARSLF